MFSIFRMVDLGEAPWAGLASDVRRTSRHDELDVLLCKESR